MSDYREMRNYIKSRLARGLDTPELEGREVLALIEENIELTSNLGAESSKANSMERLAVKRREERDQLKAENEALIARLDAFEVDVPKWTEREIRLIAENEALRKDAERYRKIRLGPIHDEEDAGIYILDQRGERYQECAVHITEEELDEAIDSAMAKEATSD